MHDDNTVCLRCVPDMKMFIVSELRTRWRNRAIQKRILEAREGMLNCISIHFVNGKLPVLCTLS
jgi:hypothetical protein